MLILLAIIMVGCHSQKEVTTTSSCSISEDYHEADSISSEKSFVDWAKVFTTVDSIHAVFTADSISCANGSIIYNPQLTADVGNLSTNKEKISTSQETEVINTTVDNLQKEDDNGTIEEKDNSVAVATPINTDKVLNAFMVIVILVLVGYCIYSKFS
jgi:hypothetical protein